MTTLKRLALVLAGAAAAFAFWISLPDLRRLLGEKRDIEVTIEATHPANPQTDLVVEIQGAWTGFSAPLSFHGQPFRSIGKYLLEGSTLRVRVPYYPGYLVYVNARGHTAGSLGHGFAFDSGHGNPTGKVLIRIAGVPPRH